VYFALVAAPESVTMRESVSYVTFETGTTPISPRSCTSAEGLHLTAWRGQPLRSARVFHTHHYVGYDMQPSCTDSETAAPPPPGTAFGTAPSTLPPCVSGSGREAASVSGTLTAGEALSRATRGLNQRANIGLQPTAAGAIMRPPRLKPCR
jgi:hypothetical protein